AVTVECTLPVRSLGLGGIESGCRLIRCRFGKFEYGSVVRQHEAVTVAHRRNLPRTGVRANVLILELSYGVGLAESMFGLKHEFLEPGPRGPMVAGQRDDRLHESVIAQQCGTGLVYAARAGRVADRRE